ncbi:phage holin family protein [Celeribacter baekdonensis]|uniref:phage holin family protein n=1 Tax=Celeribacter baekdonensis TaxID=875171 RepID=UPI003A917388
MVFPLLQRAERDIKAGARRMLWSAIAIVIAGLIAGAGVCFVLLWAYLTLSVELGPPMAAGVMGVGLIVSAGVILALSLHEARQDRTDPPSPQPAPEPTAANPETDTLPSLVAFTAAFVLARYLSDRNTDE